MRQIRERHKPARRGRWRRRDEDVRGDGGRKSKIVLTVREDDAIGSRFDDLDDLSDAEPRRENLRVGQRRLVFEVRDASELTGRPGGDRRIRRRTELAVAPGNRIAVGIEARMAERRRQGVDLIRREHVLLALRRRVDRAERQARFVGEVPFEQPVRAHDLACDASAFVRQEKLLTCGAKQSLALHAVEHAHEGAIVEPQRSLQRRKRRPSVAVFLVEEMLEGVLNARPSAPGGSPAQASHERSGAEADRDDGHDQNDGEGHLLQPVSLTDRHQTGKFD